MFYFQRATPPDQKNEKQPELPQWATIWPEVDAPVLARTPYVTWGLIVVNIAIFLFAVSRSESDEAMMAMLKPFAATPSAILHYTPAPGSMPPELTLISYMFLHGGWSHIIGNLYYLAVFGDDIEDALGHARFTAFYLLSGIGAGLFYAYLYRTSTIQLVGASGAISGILAAYVMLRPCAKLWFWHAPVPAYLLIILWLAWQVANIATPTNDGIAYEGHLGGFIVGALLFLVMRPAGVRLFECVGKSEEGKAA